ncbi:MAG: type 2 isopentenyl-diphosphate Delta-isomerase [Anaerolineae bacterium]
MHEKRKLEHIDICLHQDVRSGITSGFENYRLAHCAAPEMALADVDLTTQFCGHTLAAPVLISAMTGGTEAAQQINKRLAQAAQQFGLAMGIGSQRASIKDPNLLPTYQVRDVAPDILLFANLGAVQLNYGYGIAECRKAVESIGADALVLHLNSLQEVLQPRGNTDFRALVDRIGEICAVLSVPVIVKEVGWGISHTSAKALIQAGVAALDIAGAGGTSWSQVEYHRCVSQADKAVAAAFASWGIPTVDALVSVHRALPDTPLIASGGITNGIEIALALALGADMVGMALPLLTPAVSSLADLVEKIEVIIRQLRIAMFCTGSHTPLDLRREGIVYSLR